MELVGLLALVIFWGMILVELWTIFYTSYLGHAMGHSIEPRKLGQWAGKSEFFLKYFKPTSIRH